MSTDPSQAPTELPTVVGSESPAPLPDSGRRKPYKLYSDDVAELILESYIEGKSLLAISREDWAPSYAGIMKWCRDNEAFIKKLDAARELRAFHLEELAMEIALAPHDKDEVSDARLKFDALVWSTGVHNPARFGKKTVLSGDGKRPVIFQIITGVPESNPARIDTQPTIDVVSEVVNATEEENLGGADGTVSAGE